MASLVEDMASFVTGLEWTSVPRQFQDSARNRLLDAISTAIAARRVDTARALISAGEYLGEPSGECTVLPTGRTARAQDAALINGTAVHAILFEDIDLTSADHPGAVIIPAALAAAESATRSTGREADVGSLLTGILAGYEVHLRLGVIAATGVRARGLRTTSMFGTVGAAAAACAVLRLPYAQVREALTMAANMSFGFLEGFAHGTMEPYVQAGIAARQGLLAVALARGGVQTATTPFEGADGFLRSYADIEPGSVVTFPDQWRITNVSCKPYPISGGKIGSVDSALALRQQGIDGPEIEKVVARLPAGTKEFPGADKKGPFTTMSEAQDSTQFCIAAALLGRPMSSLRTVMDGFADAEVAELTHRIELISESGRTLTHIDVHLRDGQIKSAEVDWGHLQVPTVEKMAVKLRELTADYWTSENCESIVQLASGDPGVPVRELSRALRG